MQPLTDAARTTGGVAGVARADVRAEQAQKALLATPQHTGDHLVRRHGHLHQHPAQRHRDLDELRRTSAQVRSRHGRTRAHERRDGDCNMFAHTAIAPMPCGFARPEPRARDLHPLTQGLALAIALLTPKGRVPAMRKQPGERAAQACHAAQATESKRKQKNETKQNMHTGPQI